MERFEHTQGLNSIRIKCSVPHIYCPIGKATYTADVTIDLTPNQYLLDYVEVENFMKNYSGKQMIIEDVCAGIYSYILKEYEPVWFKVTIEVNDAVHCPVTVTKQYFH